MTIAAIGSVALPIIGGMIGQDQARADRERQMKMLEQFNAEVNKLSVPEREQLMLNLARFQSAGQLDPRLAGPAAQEVVVSDPRLVQQQMKNLQEMQAIADAGGYDPAVQASLSAALRQQEQATRAAQESIQMQAQARGMQSAGATQALQMMAAQSEANRMSQLQQQLAAQAYQNRLSALSGASSEAGRLRGSDYEEQLRRAQARDEIARFNLQTSNTAAAQNLAAKQALMEANTRLAQQEEASRAQSYKDIFDMEQAKLGLKAGSMGGLSQAYGQRAADTAKAWQVGSSGAAEALLAGSKLYGQQDNTAAINKLSDRLAASELSNKISRTPGMTLPASNYDGNRTS